MPPTLRLAGRVREIDATLVMGIVNTSPDSFSEGRGEDSLEHHLVRAASLADAGADLIDIGGESAITQRPRMDVDTEIARVVPVVSWVRRHFPDVLVSVDTYKAPVVEAVLEAGAQVINDVSGLEDPQVAALCADAGAALVIMHTSAPPKTRRQDPDLYADVTGEVIDFLRARIDVAVAMGQPRDALIIDPGPDFTKTPHQTISLLQRIDEFRELGRPLLLALSRKDFLGAITGRSPQQRDAATAAALAHLAIQPGTIVRVHDVAAAVDVIATIDVLTGRREIPSDYLLPESLRHERAHA